MKKLGIFLAAAALILLSACGGGGENLKRKGNTEIDTIVFADAGWDSIRIHNGIAQKIIEEGLGYKTKTTAGSTSATIQGLRRGDID
ncbi:glycine betaine ABC transporter substrate-binding protein, partial [Kocuria palustris]|uniref:glycine betaine ABC transporter substrate-binding protein n=2 Tax=Bacillati TaxID=1783272 RepID=UPI0039A005A9